MLKSIYTHKFLVLSISVAISILVSIASARSHDGSYEMTVKNWLENTPEITRDVQGVYTARCRKRYSGRASKILHHLGIPSLLPESWLPFDESYYEVILTSKEDSDVYGDIHFNRHFSGYMDKYSISIWGWFNTIGIQTSKQDLIWHGKPVLYRWNSWGVEEQEITSVLFETIAKEGQFTLLTENNPIRWGRLAVEATIKIDNPDELTKCFG